jgi:hypothetical protein
LTLTSNLLTGLKLMDEATCYKMFRRGTVLAVGRRGKKIRWKHGFSAIRRLIQ